MMGVVCQPLLHLQNLWIPQIIHREIIMLVYETKKNNTYSYHFSLPNFLTGRHENCVEIKLFNTRVFADYYNYDDSRFKIGLSRRWLHTSISLN